MPKEPVNKKVPTKEETKTSDKRLSGMVKLIDGERRCDHFRCKRLLPKNSEAWYYLSNYYCSAQCLLEAIKGH